MGTLFLLVLVLAYLVRTASASLSDPDEQLLNAASNADFETVQELLARGANKNVRQARTDDGSCSWTCKVCVLFP
jgi:hypothetical protein